MVGAANRLLCSSMLQLLCQQRCLEVAAAEAPDAGHRSCQPLCLALHHCCQYQVSAILQCYKYAKGRLCT